MQLVVPRPDRAYLTDMLWLPRRLIQEASVKVALQYYSVDKKTKTTRIERLWEATDSHLIVPREFFPPEHYPSFPFPFVDLTPKDFPQTNMASRVTLLPEKNQPAAYAAFSKAPGGVLNLAPGRGKTVLACKRIGDTRLPTLIVVPNTYLLEQWQEQIEKFLEFPPREKLGVIQQQRFEWQQPVVLAMIETLALRAAAGKIPPAFSRYFGQVIFDETHHLSAQFFLTTAPLVLGQRFGLTATPDRNDGLEHLYQYHLGPVFYSDMTPGIMVDVYFQQTPCWINLNSPEVRDRTGELHLGKLCNALAKVPDAVSFRESCIREALQAGRKVLCINRNKALLTELATRFSDACLLVAETPQEERTRLVRKSRVVFAISQLGLEGLDDDTIDAAFVLTPVKDQVSLIQFLGRLQRTREGKKTPIIVFFDDIKIPPLSSMCHQARKALQEKGYGYRTLAVP